MGKKGGRNKLKRLSAPRGWDISRKAERFVFKPLPATHSVASSYPLGVVVRDLAHLASTSKEIKLAVRTGRVLVDGKTRGSPAFPVGLFDVVKVPMEGLSFRLVPTPKGLVLSKVGEQESDRKLCGVRSKTKVREGRIQYGLHDGRSVLDDNLKLSPGDSLLLEVPSQKVVDKFKLAKGSLGLVLSGERAGQLGKIQEVKSGTITRERTVKMALPGGEAELPSRLVLPVGTDKPVITVGVVN